MSVRREAQLVTSPATQHDHDEAIAVTTIASSGITSDGAGGLSR